ncbi:hypothetical protein M5K25_010686 [Dendrobium thyrsiflorum]|uniref:GDSL esterase/lipase n=1 Tax=Dendrobium thyrsiflorum TaxID=117978 RepID=A0ABD0V148_DENTH
MKFRSAGWDFPRLLSGIEPVKMGGQQVFPSRTAVLDFQVGGHPRFDAENFRLGAGKQVGLPKASIGNRAGEDGWTAGFSFQDSSSGLPGKKFKKYIPPADVFSRGLYMFDIGQNDLAGAFYSKSEDQIIASIPTILLEFETGVKKLYDQGARNFWIHNTGPLGCLAQNIAQFGKDPSKLDEYGCVSSHNRAAKLFNLQLHALCTKLQAQFVDANVTYIDIFTIKSDLIANYSRYGFEHPVTVCCGYGGPPLNYDSRIRCGQTKIIDGSSVTAKGCSDATDYVNWDGIHYTDAANQFVSSQILTGKYSDPPFSDKMPFLLKLKF